MPAVAAPLSPTEIRISIRSVLAPLFRGEPDRRGRSHRASGDLDLADYRLHEHVGSDRAIVEEFISRRFAETFGSRVEAFMPRLFSLRDQNEHICGAFGLRSGQRPLFLEQYMDHPIEIHISRHIGHRVERSAIVEIGHFSGTFPGAMRTMIRLLTEGLYCEGFRWVAFTGTTELRNAFSRMGLPLIDVQAAERHRLPPEERAAWGSYYDHSPRVMAGEIRIGFDALHAAARREAA